MLGYFILIVVKLKKKNTTFMCLRVWVEEKVMKVFLPSLFFL